MAIERDNGIVFHEQGTLNAVTRLKERFAKELTILDPEGLGSVKASQQLEL